LWLGENCISDLGPLLDLPELDYLYIDSNPLSDDAIKVQIPQLESNGVSVKFSTYSDDGCAGLEGEGKPAEGEPIQVESSEGTG